MRVHSLELEAFGPFATRATIDFDALSEGGIFLLNGETGAGKTSVLDGICYALYGSLPGVRQGSKSLRSDHAEATVAPEVICEFSTGGRRFEVTRSPAWDRPSKRGKNGTTTAQAQSRLRELVDGTWIEKSTRNDEVGATLGEILGLDKEQFTKVAMLPQGAFAAFLRAKDKDREDLLRSLFDTSEYALIEKVLAERFAEARLEADAAERTQRSTVDHLVADALTTLYPHDTELPQDMAALHDAAEFTALGEGFGTTLNAARKKLQQDLKDTDSLAAAARAAQASLKERGTRHAQLAELSELRHVHEEQGPGVAELRSKLRLDAGAAAIRPYHQQLESCAQAKTDAEAALGEAIGETLDLFAQGTGGKPDEASAALLTAAQTPDAPIDAVRELAAQAKSLAITAVQKAAVIEAALPDEKELAATQGELRKLKAALESDTALQLERAGKLKELQDQVPHLEAQRAALDAKVSSLPALESVLAEARERRDFVAARSKAERAQIEAHTAFNQAKSQTLLLREDAADLIALRLDQSAAALAAQLRDGESCLVCGSVEHPRPATLPSGELVDAESVGRAQELVGVAESAEAKAAARLEKANTALALIRGKIGDLEVETATEELDVATLARQSAAESAAAATEAAARLAQAKKKLELLQADSAHAATKIEVAGTKVEAAQARIAKLTDSLAALSAGGQDLQERHQVLRAEARIFDSLAAAASTLAGAARAADSAALRWEAELGQAGIASTAAWLGQLLPVPEREAHERRVDDHNNQAVRITTLAEDPETALARTEAESGTGAPEPAELAEAESAIQEALRRRDGVLAQDAVLQSYAGRLRANLDKLASLALEQGPVLERFNTLKSLAELARGSGENRLKMTLSTYVLAARLESVALAATQRLLLMTGQRYSLVHDDTPRGNNKSGLGLQILDSWTGVRRDTQTLSGGESFMASLSLALGLADVIQHQSGGIDIETLFVDEGFGSLDAETLEQVMDALEALRSGGRVIGVVSHVADMKQRITTRLNVHKGRNGSTVSLEI